MKVKRDGASPTESMYFCWDSKRFIPHAYVKLQRYFDLWGLQVNRTKLKSMYSHLEYFWRHATILYMHLEFRTRYLQSACDDLLVGDPAPQVVRKCRAIQHGRW